MTPAKLEKSVNRQLKYIDKRLLSGKGAKQIYSSDNASAIELLKDSKKARNIISEQISKGKFEDAYWALKTLGNQLRTALKMVRAKGTDAKKIKNDLESAQIASDAFAERAVQRGIRDGNGGQDAQKLFKQAEKKRIEGSQHKLTKKYGAATQAFLDSSDLLKKSIATSKRQGYSSSSSGKKIAEQKTLPKGMTPKKLKKSVTRQYKYITTRLLSKKAAQKIKDSQNSEAIKIFEQSHTHAGSIASTIDKEQYEQAYWALKDLAASLKDAMKLARSKDRKAKNTKDQMESALAISDAYLERARQKGIDKIKKGSGSLEALDLFRRSVTERTDGEASRSQKNYKCASKAYQLSSEFLKRSIALNRKWRKKRESE